MFKLNLVRFPNLNKRPPLVKAVKKGLLWNVTPSDSLKFNIDGSSRGKLGPVGIGGVLRDNTAAIKLVFSKAIGVANSNVAELLAVREALSVYTSSRWASSHRCEIVHISRSVNDIFDALAKSGVTRLVDLVVSYD
ncbi:hypothetical protein CRYUN_Cryun13aG0071000 [Craigia yunnanensis]